MAFMQELQGLLSGMAGEAAKLRAQVDSLTHEKESYVAAAVASLAALASIFYTLPPPPAPLMPSSRARAA